MTVARTKLHLSLFHIFESVPVLKQIQVVLTFCTKYKSKTTHVTLKNGLEELGMPRQNKTCPYQQFMVLALILILLAQNPMFLCAAYAAVLKISHLSIYQCRAVITKLFFSKLYTLCNSGDFLVR